MGFQTLRPADGSHPAEQEILDEVEGLLHLAAMLAVTIAANGLTGQH